MDPCDARSATDLRVAMRRGARPRFLFFWSHRPQSPGRIDDACFSQWWPVTFCAEGHEFHSAEQYMMWRKATTFRDDTRAEAITAARSPAQAKALGRLVRGFDEHTWRDVRWDIVVEASTLKFGSDPALGGHLLATGRRVLVEASPTDRIWGIGLTADSAQAKHPDRWRGQNLLGFALMEARARLS